MKERKGAALLLLLTGVGFMLNAQTFNLNLPLVSQDLVFEEKNGLVAVEAEYFYEQQKTVLLLWAGTKMLITT